MGKRAVGPTKRAQAVALFETGINVTDISRQQKISRHCVTNATKRYDSDQIFNDRKRPGRPMKLNDRHIRYLKRLVKGESRLSASNTTANLNTSLATPISSRTVRRCLKKLGYEYMVKVKKQYLTKKHREKRVTWCGDHQNWTKEQWRQVIFSDESVFYVLKRKNQVKIWRTNDELLLPECVEQANTGDGGKITIWGGISGYATTLSRTFQENMNSQLYADILEKELQKSIKKLPKNTNVQFQHDNAPWHCSDSVKAKLKKLKINLMDWPSKSPDLNCVENLWSIMDKRLTSTPVHSKQELEERLQQIWDEIDIDVCVKLVDSMPTRIRKCLAAKGGHFM